MLEIVVVGTGDKSSRLDPKIQSYLRKHYISLEVQDTVSGFPLIFSSPNVLSSEDIFILLTMFIMSICPTGKCCSNLQLSSRREAVSWSCSYST